MLHKEIILSFAILSAFSTEAQQTDSILTERFSFHFQNTIITQYKPTFKAAYTCSNSLIPQEETQTSSTATIFADAKLWKGGSIFINPELADGAALSQAFEVADATNGETFRVGKMQGYFFVPVGMMAITEPGLLQKLTGLSALVFHRMEINGTGRMTMWDWLT